MSIFDQIWVSLIKYEFLTLVFCSTDKIFVRITFISKHLVLQITLKNGLQYKISDLEEGMNEFPQDVDQLDISISDFSKLSGGIHTCLLCNYTTNRKNNLVRHFDSIHKNKKPPREKGIQNKELYSCR